MRRRAGSDGSPSAMTTGASRERLLQRPQIRVEPPRDVPDGIRLFVGDRDAKARDQRALAGIPGADDAAREAGRAKQDADAELRAAEAARDSDSRDVGDGIDV